MIQASLPMLLRSECLEVVGRETNPVAPPDFVDGTACMGLVQGRGDLRLVEFP